VQSLGLAFVIAPERRRLINRPHEDRPSNRPRW
jgi:hypothetical protein